MNTIATVLLLCVEERHLEHLDISVEYENPIFIWLDLGGRLNLG
jgi:hypothetical protein